MKSSSEGPFFSDDIPTGVLPYKGKSTMSAGYFYCPYVPLNHVSAPLPDQIKQRDPDFMELLEEVFPKINVPLEILVL